jgi:hypothetical protein
MERRKRSDGFKICQKKNHAQKMAAIFCAWFFERREIEKHGQKTEIFLESGLENAAVYWNQPEQDEKLS